jgi:co-chaperonin GroES (HSP10)
MSIQYLEKIIPNVDKILVQREAVETKSGGIILPESAQSKSTTGKVLAVGKLNEKYNILIGDIVYLPQYGGIEISDDGVIVIDAEKILAIRRGG